MRFPVTDKAKRSTGRNASETHRRKTGRAPPVASPSLLAHLLGYSRHAGARVLALLKPHGLQQSKSHCLRKALAKSTALTRARSNESIARESRLEVESSATREHSRDGDDVAGVPFTRALCRAPSRAPY